MTIPILTRLRDLTQNYDAVLCDAWGVIHNGVSLFPDVGAALSAFRRECGPVIILTNAPRPSAIIPPQLDRLGFDRAAYDGVVTSGDATRAEIEKLLPKPAFRIGPEKDDPLFDGLGINFRDEANAEFVICTGLFNDQVEVPEDYRDLLGRLAAKRLPMVCANPDIVVNWGGRMVWCAGALAEIYAELGGTVIFGGKPHQPIYELAHAALNKLGGAPIPRSRILAIGDGLATDIGGANRYGIDALYIFGAGGIHEGETSPSAIADRLESAGVESVAAMERLAW